MNNIFQNNIQALNKKNPKLAEKLKTYLPDELPEIVKENNAYNLKYKGRFIHNPLSPLGEAREIFAMATNEPVAIHVIYGIGLGYLFQVASLNSNGTVILYEPDLNVLWMAFSLVDFSSDILKNNVFITDTFEDTSLEIYKKSNTQNTPQLLSLSSAREYDREGFDELVRKLQELVGAYSMDLKYTKEKFYPSLKMLFQNIKNLMNEQPLAVFKDCLKGKTAVIVSAGPTLDKNIEILKKYRDKFVLFTVGTAIKTLYKNGIKPDFLCIIETYNSSKQVEGLDLSDVYFITEPYSNPQLRRFKYKKIFSHISANAPINQFWSEICDEKIEEYGTKGTVSYTALNCARLLGCGKIILVGQDLAYIEGQCYSKDSAYKDLVCKYNSEYKKWEITANDFDAFASSISPSEDKDERYRTANRRLERLNSSLYHVKGIRGDMLPTESVYATFIKPLSEYAEHFNNVKYINTSLVGAQIDGYENLSLEEALKDSEKIGNIILESDFEYNKNLISKRLTSYIEGLNSALNLINDGKRNVKNLRNDLKRKRTVDEDILKLLKKLSIVYLNLSGEFSSKNKLFDIITAASKINLDYELKMMQDFKYENVVRICEKISEFLDVAETNSVEITNIIKGITDENFNTKS
ncbi:MAG: DUF115 domain-containing protein [bacterium]|nr:DUF115 domain-containing protein [bacterium]